MEIIRCRLIVDPYHRLFEAQGHEQLNGHIVQAYLFIVNG